MSSPSQARSRAVAAITAVLALFLGAGISTGAAFADTSPAPGLPETVSSDPLPTAQIDGVVWSQVIIGDTVYVGGKFSTARPAGAAAGENTVPRGNLLAYSLTTGELQPWAPSANAEVLSLSASPDGTRLYAAGVFTTIDGQSRNRVAAFDVATGALNAGFRPSPNSGVDVVKVTGSTVYIGGNFTAVGGATRTRVAALNPSTGAALPFTATAEGGRVRAIAVSPDAAKIVVGGSFTTLNGSGNPGYGMGALNATTGASMAWNANAKVRNGGVNAAVYSLTSDSTGVYGTGYVFGSGGNEEGAFRADWANGDLVWADSCLGDTYSLGLTANVAYIAGHHHDCSTSNGFPQTSPDWTYQRGMALAKSYMGNVSIGAKWGGTPAPTALDWWPDFDTGTASGQGQGPWSVAATEQYVAYAGEFMRVNNTPQQGLVRFAVKSIAPNKDGPRLGTSSYVPNLVSSEPGAVRINWRANWDRDNASLTYQVIRDGINASPIYTATQDSHAWYDRPTMTYLDKNLEPGSTHTYRIRVNDPWGNVAWGDPASVTVASAGTVSGYANAVIADRPVSFWRLGEASGTKLTDWAGTNNAVAGTGVTLGQAGAVQGDADTAARFSGSSPNGMAATQTAVLPPTYVSVEAWFRTSTTSGGKIVGFGNMATGNSTNNYDRDIVMNSTGQLVFGVRASTSTVSVTTTPRYNDNAWHHVVGTVGTRGIELYVDGAKVASRTGTTTAAWTYPGYWRIGGDTITGAVPRYFNGTIDEVAVYDRALDAATIARHNDLGRSGAAVNVPPTASFTSTVANLDVSVNGSGSTDTDGLISSYSWNWGDGTAAGSGATATHSYATPGTYQVTLTVTDNGGATAAKTGSVTVTAPPAPGADLAKDGFTRAVSGGLGSAETGGLWTVVNTASSYSVSSGAAQLATTAGATRTAYLGSVASTDTDVQATAAFSVRPTTGSAYASVAARRVGSDDYTARAVVSSTGTVQLQLQRTGTTLTSATVAGLTYAAGDRLAFRVQAVGTAPTTLRAKVWKAGTAEPATWQVTTTDTTAALQSPGGVGISSYLSASASPTSYTVSFDDLIARPSSAAPAPNAVPTAAFTATPAGLSVAVDGSGSADSDGTVASYAWDFGDGGTGTGATASHDYATAGTYSIRLTVTDDKGATGTTTRSVTVTAPAGNASPTASFTSTANGLGVSVDGSASADADGTVAAYSWNWGDGTAAGSGATATHTYATAGTYTVTLTVTDDGGATGTATRSVTVTAPPPAGVLASDDFSRTTTGSWGAATVGGTWTSSSSTTSYYSVDGSAGKLTTASAGKTPEVYLNGVTSTNASVTATITPSGLPVGGSAYASVIGRRVGTDDYRARVVISAAGAVTLQLQRTGTTLTTASPAGLTYAAGDTLQVRLLVTGTSPTTVSAKVWKVGTTEPAAWQATTTDTTAALQQAGSFGLGMYLGSTATSVPYSLAFDGFAVTQP